MPAESKPILHEQIAEEGVIKDHLQAELEELVGYLPVVEDAFVDMAKNINTQLKGISIGDLDLEGLSQLEEKLQSVNELSLLNEKYTRLQAQSKKALADQERAEINVKKAVIDLENKQNKIKQDSVKMTNEQVAAQRLKNQQDAEAIKYIIAKTNADNKSLGTMQRLVAQNTQLRMENKKLDLSTKEGQEIWKRNIKIIDDNSTSLRLYSDGATQQAMNVGNYMKSLRPLQELIRGIAYAMGMHVEGLREYAGVIRGATHFAKEYSERQKENTEAVKANTAAMSSQRDIEEDDIVIDHAKVESTEEMTAQAELNTGALVEQNAAMLASVPVIGWVVAGIVALGAGIALAITATEAHRKAINERSKAMDGSIIRDKKQRDDWNEHIIKMGELNDQYDVLIGKITEYDSKIAESQRASLKSLADLKDEETENIQKQTSLFGSWTGFKNKLVDGWVSIETLGLANTGLTEERKEELVKQYEGPNGTITRILNETEAKQRIIIEEMIQANYKAMAELKIFMDNQAEEINAAQNALVRNNEERQKLDLANKLKYEQMKNDAEILALKDSGKKDPETLEKLAELNQKKLDLNTVYYLELKKLYNDSAIEHRKVLLGELLEEAKFTRDKVAIAKAEYEQAENETASDANLTPGERLLKEKNDASKYARDILEIKRDSENKWAEIDKQAIGVIENKYQKEIAIAQDTYETELRDYKRLLDDKEISLDQYNAKVILSEQARQQTLAAIDEDKRTTSNIKTDDINATFAKNVTAADENRYASAKQILIDQKNELAAEWSKATDELKKKDDLDVKQGIITQEQEDADLLNLKEDYYNKVAALDKKFKEEEIDRELKAAENVTNAIAESLQRRSDMLQEADQRDIDNHNRLVNTQAKLAAEGRANVLGQEEAQAEKAEEKKIQDAKKAQKEQMAFQLANIILELTAAYAKAGNTNNPEFKALETALATKALATAFAGSYAKGVERLEGPGTGTSDSLVIRASKDESVITADGTLDNPGLPTAMNEGTVSDYFERVYLPQYLAANGISSPANSMESPQLLNEIRGLRGELIAIKNKPVQSVNFKGLAEWDEEIRNENHAMIVHHLKPRRRLR